MTFAGFWDTIILLGIVQGFILTGLLFFSGKQQPANRLLAALIGLITLACLNIYLLDAAWLSSHILLHLLADALPLVVIMPLGPLIWFYVQATMNPAFRMGRKQYIHYWPIALDLFPYCLLLVADIGSLTGTLSKGQRGWVSNFIDQYNVYSDIPRWLSLTSYLWLSHQYIRQKRQQQELPETGIRWLRQFLLLFLVFQGIWLLYLIPYVIPATRQALLNAVDWYPIFVPLAILIYWLGLKGYLVGHRPVIENTHKVMVPVATRLPETTAQQFVERLRNIMEVEKLYLDPALSVNALAQQAGMAPKMVSAVLNQHLDKSFSVFVNEYRVEAFKKRIQQPGAASLTIPGIAMECGFSSVATFQRMFKQLTGATPSRFMQEAKEAGKD